MRFSFLEQTRTLIFGLTLHVQLASSNAAVHLVFLKKHDRAKDCMTTPEYISTYTSH